MVHHKAILMKLLQNISVLQSFAFTIPFCQITNSKRRKVWFFNHNLFPLNFYFHRK